MTLCPLRHALCGFCFDEPFLDDSFSPSPRHTISSFLRLKGMGQLSKDDTVSAYLSLIHNSRPGTGA
jgi:hypothetical protein